MAVRCIFEPAGPASSPRRCDSLARDTSSAFTAWLRSRGVDAAREDADAYVAADDARLARNDIYAVPALLARRAATGEGGEAALQAKLKAILDVNQAPVSGYALALWRQALTDTSGSGGFRDRGRRRAATLARGLPRLELRFADDASLEWLRLEEALAWEDAGAFADAAPLLARVLATPPAVLPQDAVVRRVALLHTTIVARFSGDAAGADARLAASGVSAQQCLLFDTHPIPASISVASSQFPAEALRWRFEGYVREAFDITDDGRVAHPRTVVAYPPFVFAESTEDAVKSFRYVPPRIGSTAVGCTGQVQSVRYRMAP